MNKKKLVALILDTVLKKDPNSNFKKQKNITKESVDIFFNSIQSALLKGDRVEIRGLGSFSVKSYKPYVGRNPKTGQPVEVGKKMVPNFRPGKAFKAYVNDQDDFNGQDD